MNEVYRPFCFGYDYALPIVPHLRLMSSDHCATSRWLKVEDVYGGSQVNWVPQLIGFANGHRRSKALVAIDECGLRTGAHCVEEPTDKASKCSAKCDITDLLVHESD